MRLPAAQRYRWIRQEIKKPGLEALFQAGALTGAFPQEV